MDLCDCEFSLAYGAKILLNNTRLRLKKGRRYGLCGPNGAGKVGLGGRSYLLVSRLVLARPLPLSSGTVSEMLERVQHL